MIKSQTRVVTFLDGPRSFCGDCRGGGCDGNSIGVGNSQHLHLGNNIDQCCGNL